MPVMHDNLLSQSLARHAVGVPARTRFEVGEYSGQRQQRPLARSMAEVQRNSVVGHMIPEELSVLRPAI